MEGSLRNIIKEEFGKVMSKKYSRDEVSDAIFNKSFIYSKDGSVYSPVKFDHDYVVGVNDDCEYVNIHLEEIALIQSQEERFKK